MNSRRQSMRRRQQGGFALLVVFLFAAVVAFSLYQQVPRAAFEYARDKEQLLIDRGSEYQRAIEVFYAVNKRYPATLDELEKSTDKRYLRRRYVDPMTGKDEWRIIHTNGTFLTDSLVQKPPAQNAGSGQPGVLGNNPGPLGANSMNTASGAFSQNASTGAASAGGGSTANPNEQPQAPNPAVLRRPSDRTLASAFGAQQPIDPDTLATNEPPPFDPSNLPPITLTTPTTPASPQQTQPGNLAVPGQQQNVPGTVNLPGIPGTNSTNASPGVFNPLGNQPAQSGQPTQNMSPQAAFAAAFGQQQPEQDQQPQTVPPGGLPAFIQQPSIPGQAPGQGGFNPQPSNAPSPSSTGNNQNLVTIGPGGQLVPFPNQNPSQAITPAGRAGGTLPQPNPTGNTNPALALIGQQLRTPTPTATQNAIQPAANNLGSPGIAGVASKFEGPSIKSYRERTKYQEWEFVFDPQNSRLNQQAGQANPANRNQQNPLQPNQTTPQTSSPTGNQNLFTMPNFNQPGR